ncbi:MAG: O-antigen ligase family protein [Patescibacteria group bacterium]
MKLKFLEKIIKIGTYAAMLAPLVFIPQVIFSTVLGKMIYFQIIVEIIFPFYIYLIIAYPEARPKISSLTKIILAFFIVLVVTSLFGADFHKSFWGDDQRMRGIFSLLHFLAFYFYVITCFCGERDKKNILRFAIAIGMAIGLFAFLERYNPEFSIDKVSVKNLSSHRVISTTGNPIFLAGYMLFIFFLSAYFFLKNKDWFRPIAAIAAAISLLTVFFTETRAAFLGLGAGVVLSFFYLFFLLPKKQKIFLFGGFLCALAVVLIMFNLGYFSRLISRFNDASVSGRFLLWKTSLESFKEKPLLGWGLENFDYAFDKNYDAKFLRNGMTETWADRAHNLYLDFLVMSGIFGLIAFLAILLFPAIKMLRERTAEKAPLFGLLAAFGFFSIFSVESPDVFLMLFFVLAIIDNEIYKNEIKKMAGAVGDRKVFFAAAVALAFICIYFFNIKSLYGGAYLLEYGRAEGPAEKRELAEKIFTDSSPYANAFKTRLANNTFYDSGDDKAYSEWALQKTIGEMEGILQKNPNDFGLLHLLGNLYLRRGSSFSRAEDYDKAVEYYNRALFINPKRQATAFQLATTYILKNETRKAVELLEKTMAFDNSAGQMHWRLAVAYLADGQEEKAYEFFKNSVNKNFFDKIDKERFKAIDLCEKYHNIECANKIALSFYEDAASEHPNDLAYQLELFRAYALAGNLEDARSGAEKMFKVFPDAKDDINAFLEELKNYVR